MRGQGLKIGRVRGAVKSKQARGASQHGHAIKSILRQKKNYENSNILPCKNAVFKENPLKETKTLQDIIALELISSFNTSQNIVSKYYLSKILV
jgi:hypothetical protein